MIDAAIKMLALKTLAQGASMDHVSATIGIGRRTVYYW